MTDNEIDGIVASLAFDDQYTYATRPSRRTTQPSWSQEEYVKVIQTVLEIILLKHIVSPLITGMPRVSLMSPNKWEVLNAIETEMRRRVPMMC